MTVPECIWQVLDELDDTNMLLCSIWLHKQSEMLALLYAPAEEDCEPVALSTGLGQLNGPVHCPSPGNQNPT